MDMRVLLSLGLIAATSLVPLPSNAEGSPGDTGPADLIARLAPKPSAEFGDVIGPHEIRTPEAEELSETWSLPVPDVDGDGFEDVLVTAYGVDFDVRDIERIFLLSGADGSELYRYDIPALSPWGSGCCWGGLYEYIYLFDATGDGLVDALTVSMFGDHYSSQGPVANEEMTVMWSLMDGSNGTLAWQHTFSGNRFRAASFDRFESFPWAVAFVDDADTGAIVMQMLDGIPSVEMIGGTSTMLQIDLASGAVSTAASIPLTDTSALVAAGALTTDGDLSFILAKDPVVVWRNPIAPSDLTGIEVTAVDSQGNELWNTVVDLPAFTSASIRDLSPAGPDFVIEARWYVSGGGDSYQETMIFVLDGDDGNERFSYEARDAAHAIIPDSNFDGGKEIAFAEMIEDGLQLTVRAGADFHVISTQALALDTDYPDIECCVGDLDGNGLEDFIVTDFWNTIGISNGTMTQLWSEASEVEAARRDIDGDGTDDVAIREDRWISFLSGDLLRVIARLPFQYGAWSVGNFSQAESLDVVIDEDDIAPTVTARRLDGTQIWQVAF